MPNASHQREVERSSGEAKRVTNSPATREIAAFASHELRGPIHTLQAFLSVMLKEQPGPLNELQRDFISSMFTISQRLERLAGDIHIMLVEGAGLPIQQEEVDVLQLLEEASRELDRTASAYGVSIQIGPVNSDTKDLVVDPDRFSQIAINLLENAVRNSVKGSVVKVICKWSRSWFLLSVGNEPVDAPSEADLADWFAPFVRGKGAHERAPRGSGLGLAVVSHLVAALEGKIATRTSGRGVTIAVLLPRSGISQKFRR
jgi:signal transduction histidine kinase